MADRSILQEYLAQRKDRAQAKIKNPVPSLKVLFEMNFENTEESKEESSALSQFFDMSIKNFAYDKGAQELQLIDSDGSNLSMGKQESDSPVEDPVIQYQHQADLSQDQL